ncbi:Uncharacterised protein [Vibrio cholerae]|nr:Uncharacterised protein [Vibrio cholerae]CSI71520.1 Uncharacterised protein [Vibrio cholerae]
MRGLGTVQARCVWQSQNQIPAPLECICWLS